MEVMGISDSSEEEEEREVILQKKKSYRQRIIFFVFDESDFITRFRLRPSEAESVLNIIGPYLKHKTNKNFALSPQQQFLVTLHWLALGTTYVGISDMHGIGKSTVERAVKRVVSLIVRKMSSNVIRWPNDCSQIALKFLRKGGFPSVCGAIDGTIIKIIAPSRYEEQYVDRHGNHSLNAMFICGPDYKFYSMNARFPGSVHDARVLRVSHISTKFENGWRPFPGGVLLGDSGYGLKSWLITTLRRNPNDPQEQRFNAAHKRTRRIVENAFGILKNRFICLKFLRVAPEFAANVVTACATLHNIASKRDFWIREDTDDTDDIGIDDAVDNDARAKIAELLSYF